MAGAASDGIPPIRYHLHTTLPRKDSTRTCRNYANGLLPSATASRMSWCVFDVPSLEAEAAALEAQSAEPDFWNEQQSAQDAMRRHQPRRNSE